MKKAIYLLAFLVITLSSCKSNKPKKPFLDTIHVAGTLTNISKMTTDNTINLYDAEPKLIRKTKCKVKWKNCFLHKKKYSKTVKDSLMTLHVQYRKKVLTSPYVIVKTNEGKEVAIFVDEIQLDKIKQFQNSNTEKPLHLMFQGIKINKNQLVSKELTSIYFEK